jgi:hypothetical protein
LASGDECIVLLERGFSDGEGFISGVDEEERFDKPPIFPPSIQCCGRRRDQDVIDSARDTPWTINRTMANLGLSSMGFRMSEYLRPSSNPRDENIVFDYSYIPEEEVEKPVLGGTLQD